MEFGGSCPMCRVGQYQLCLTGPRSGHPARPDAPRRLRRLLRGARDATLSDSERRWLCRGRPARHLAVGVHAVNIGRPRVGDSVVVLGCGVIGLDVIQCLRTAGVGTIIAVAKYDFQAEAARRLGASERS